MAGIKVNEGVHLHAILLNCLTQKLVKIWKESTRGNNTRKRCKSGYEKGERKTEHTISEEMRIT